VDGPTGTRPIPVSADGALTMKHASESDIEHLRQLMAAGHHDQEQAEKLLRQYDPHSLPDNILDVWLHGELEEQYRADRVRTAWRGHR
jgi:hypothetical protein